MNLDILHQDDWLVAINKPHGMFVHRTPMDKEATVFALQLLRDQIGRKVNPLHRIDRKTSGIVLFSTDLQAHKGVEKQFHDNLTEKEYVAILRGFSDSEGTIDYAISNECGKVKDAITRYQTLKRVEIDLPFGKFPTSRYSLVKAFPKTGRYHQLRKHFAHILHPIIGDRPHGCNKQNKLFKEKWNMTTMMLCATKLSFQHPILDKKITIHCEPSQEFNHTLELLEQLEV